MGAAADRPGIIPGSMGSPSYHVLGRGCEQSLCSSSHGAGRAMSRDRARRSVSSLYLIEQMQGVWFDQRATARLTEEAPSAYKNITAVIRAQKKLTRPFRELRPVLSYKAP
jgi:tRNA-splicing ligase RtcB